METLIWLGENAKNVSEVSYKIYQAKAEGSSLVTNWGPVSVIGRKTVRGWVKSQTKTFDSPAEAREALRKQIGAKLQKGYSVAKPAQIPR
jgi:predicted DNA-binding WGR domain protein